MNSMITRNLSKITRWRSIELFFERLKIPSSYARVLFDYTASDEHELSLKEAQVIQLMSAIDSDGFYIARDSVFKFFLQICCHQHLNCHQLSFANITL